jgi:hypothetical protein
MTRIIPRLHPLFILFGTGGTIMSRAVIEGDRVTKSVTVDVVLLLFVVR